MTREERYQFLKADIMPVFILNPAGAMHRLIERIVDLEMMLGLRDNDEAKADEAEGE